MAATTRQSSLLIQQDWTRLYQTFRNADFQSYDYDTLRKSMIDYLRTYYPEDFNDFTDSSEFIALIDLIAFLGQSLAFRADLNARENFIDTAERRDSILKLARLISYNPKRNIPASGYLKFRSVSTTETVFDSNGLNLANLLITWNDAGNENWLEQLTGILNAAMVNAQVISKPGSRKVINGITTEEYTISVVASSVPVYKFTSVVEGVNMAFEAVSPTSYGVDTHVYETPPKPSGLFNVLYKNDNQGNSSANTGFFLYFKQGELKNLDFSINDSLPNRVVKVPFSNINNTDTWLYSVNTQGTPDLLWEQVVAINGTNIIYNQSNQQKLVQVNSTAGDQVELVFGDGAFAAIPQGGFRFYYRQSNGLEYNITPDEMQAVTIVINYVSRTGRTEALSIVADLNYTVSNATATESIEEIRTKAPQQYYTQNRMITGEDYNILPYTSYSNILKVKAVNRASSGVSRYLDVMDSSGKYSSTNIFADDGLIYKNYSDLTTTFTYSTNSEVNRILYNIAKPMVSAREVSHLYYEYAPRIVPQDLMPSNVPSGSPAVWRLMSSIGATSSGYFNNNAAISESTSNNYKYISVGALIKFVPPSGSYFNKDNQIINGTPSLTTDKLYIYASVNNVDGTIATLSQLIPTFAIVEYIIPKFTNDWPSSLISTMANKVLANKNFGIRYDPVTTSWLLIDNTALSMVNFDISSAGSNLDSSWLLAFTYRDGQYTITQRNLTYYAESKLQTRFYFDPKVKVYDSSTGLTIRDNFKVLKSNSQPDSNSPLATDQIWYIYDSIVQPDGYVDSKRVKITFPDSNNDGIPDDPTLFDHLVTANATNKYVFFETTTEADSFISYNVVDANTVITTYPTKNLILNNVLLYKIGQIFYATDEGKFYVYAAGGITESSSYISRNGRQDIYFQYRHNSPNNFRIDPSPNNIMDLYILTKAFNTSYAAWIRDSSNKVAKPLPPTSEELRANYVKLEDLKALSDTLIYNSAKFKPIFGAKAAQTLQATFKIVKNPNVTLSDNDVKSQVVAAINTYFDISNWDFGETFYFSELSAYLHNKLTPNVSSIIMVPNAASAQFGGLYQINAEPNEIITSAATVDNVVIISAITASQLNQITNG